MTASTRARFAILGVGLWTDRFATAADYIAGSPVEEPKRPGAGLVPSRQRRRCSVLTRAIATAFGEALEASGLAADELPVVCGSAWGECDTLPVLLESVFDDDIPTSPMRFAASVHNTASGTLSIATGARCFATSIAAGEATTSASLLEAVSLLAAGHAYVAVVVGDSRIPDVLGGEVEGHGTLAVGIILARSDAPLAVDMPLFEAQIANTSSPYPAAAAHVDNPCRHALSLVDLGLGDGATADLGPLHPRAPDQRVTVARTGGPSS